jgi:small subunit ribosomal protein S27Ae
MGRKEKKSKKKGKKQRTGRKHENLKRHTYYNVSSGSAERSRKSCPRCGPGIWLAAHKGRAYCGRCNYTEFDRIIEKPVEKKEAPKTEKPKEAPKAEKE